MQQIWVESQPGQGSTYAFTLPVVFEQRQRRAEVAGMSAFGTWRHHDRACPLVG
jgi:hypothetical protein